MKSLIAQNFRDAVLHKVKDKAFYKLGYYVFRMSGTVVLDMLLFEVIGKVMRDNGNVPLRHSLYFLK